MFNLNFSFLQNIKNLIYPFYKNKDLKFILETAKVSQKINSCDCGGCVRKTSNQKVDDIDIATILTSDQIKEKLRDTNLKVIDTGLKHGTVTISNNQKVEITTLRKDVKTDGRHAEVEFTDNWKLDSERILLLTQYI